MSTHSLMCSITRILVLGLVFLAGQGQAHGLRGMIGMSETICATASYDDGGPMSYGGVEISAPDSELPFQSGFTDRNGLFCFQPDSLGEWQLTINDEMGHRVSLKTVVSQDLVLAQGEVAHEHNGQSMGKTEGLVGGVGFIFGLSGCLAWWQSRKKNKESEADSKRPDQEKICGK